MTISGKAPSAELVVSSAIAACGIATKHVQLKEREATNANLECLRINPFVNSNFDFNTLLTPNFSLYKLFWKWSDCTPNYR